MKTQPSLKKSSPKKVPAERVVIATLIENCKLTGIKPHTWLSTTLTSLANGHPRGSTSSWDTLTWPENTASKAHS